MTAPTHAMVLAAGLGTRMRPLTLTRPKPLIAVAGRTMLDRALDRLRTAGVGRIVVNAHWLAPLLADHVAGQSDITLSPEAEVLETGGGVVNALPLLGEDPFYVVNSDIIWTDGAVPALERLARTWDDSRMDAVLLLVPTDRAMGYDGVGDFFLDPSGIPTRRGDRTGAPLLFSGVQILAPRLFAGLAPTRFSLNLVYDRALAAGRLAAIIHDGGWYHVGTPDALEPTEAALRAAGHGIA